MNTLVRTVTHTAILLGFQLAVCPRASAEVFHVNTMAPHGGDGVSWATAFSSLQSALSVAGAGDEVWIAEGTYRALSTFVITPGVVVRGGFAGNELAYGDRPGSGHDTILVGVGTSVVLVESVSTDVPETTLERLTIRDGVGGPVVGTTVLGGGVTVRNASVRIASCTIGPNRGVATANAVSPLLCSPGFNCYLGANGSGLLAWNARVTIDGCAFLDNVAGNSLSLGCDHGTTTYQPSGHGGAIAARDSHVIIRESSFSGNRSGTGGSNSCGLRFSSSPGGHGGAIYTYGGKLQLDRCEFRENAAGQGGGGDCGLPSESGYGGAIASTNAESLTITNCRFNRNHAGHGTNAPCEGSVGRGGHGGAIFASGSVAMVSIVNTVFSSNASGDGGNPTGSWIGGMRPGTGAAIFAPGGNIRIVNCTFSNNTAGKFGQPPAPSEVASAVSEIVASSGADVFNSIFVNNEGISSDPFRAQAGQFRSIVRSCVHLSNAGVIPGVITSNPVLVDVYGPNGISGDADDDYRLSPGSPCIDSGDNTAYLDSYSTLDALGNPRRMDDPNTVDTGLGTAPFIDIGAFEFRSTGPACGADLDNGSGTGTPDGAITIEDLHYFLDAFLSGGVEADVGDGTALGTPDGAVTIDDLLNFLAHFNAGC